MEKKYIIKLDDNKLAYTAIIIDGVPYIKPLQLLPYTEPDTSEAYQRGLNDAWETARKIAVMPDGKLEAIFGTSYLTKIFTDYSASEAIEKIQQYEQEKEEQIQVGDEVEWMGDKYVVTYVRCEAKKADLISCKFGSACENVAFSALVKTGKHFPEIAEVLKKMREE